MAGRRFVSLIEENMQILDRLSDRVKRDPSRVIGYTHQQLRILIRLYVLGSTRLKEISKHERIPTPNLCMLFRNLERDGLVVRNVDDGDRRNMWYDLTDEGRKVARSAKEAVCNAIEELFAPMSHQDEEELIKCLKIINNILQKLEVKNA